MSEPSADISAGISAGTVRHLATLARLELTAPEQAALVHDLGRIVAHTETLATLDLDGVEPATGAFGRQGSLRADTPRASLPREVLLRGAPRSTPEGFEVPSVLEGGV
ncbi:MAG: Asp-tRNA(Asn)/Glu-tRNA(Gln) amidotransferase subunit GatC [Planctomycetota bacterium]